jgi:3-oxoacyl-[acyl-carrier protein] reductase
MVSLLKDKVCVVTGAARGIGRAIALRFARERGQLILVDRNERDLESAVKEIASFGGVVRSAPADVSDGDQVTGLFDVAMQEFGRVDVLVNNAAVAKPKLIIECTDAEWDEVMSVNLRGVFLCSRAGARLMIAGGRGGRIVNLSSINVRRAEPYYGAYISAKGGVEALTMTLAAELGPYRITVNAVAPGSVFTPMNKSIDSQEKILWKERRIPLGVIAQPEDIVPAVLFFASDEAWYVTGQILHADGGSFVNANREVEWRD